MTALTTEDITAIRQLAAEADRSGALPQPLVALIQRRGWLNMLAPRHCGGAELPLPEAVRLQECLAGADGNLGWLITLCAGAGWFGGFLPPATARAVFAATPVCLAGSGAPSGTADITEDGFTINGRWHHATGADIASHFTFNARLCRDGQPLLTEDGAPLVQAFVVPAAAVTRIANWRALGMRASSTHSFAVKDVRVAADSAFTIAASAATCDGPLYQFPFLALAYATFAANLAGMAGRFVELAAAILPERVHPLRQCALHQLPDVRALLTAAREDLHRARTDFYGLLDHAWQQVCAGRGAAVSGDDFRRATLAVLAAGRRAVNDLYPLCGLRAADPASEINRVWRDFHTASQHALLLP